VIRSHVDVNHGRTVGWGRKGWGGEGEVTGHSQMFRFDITPATSERESETAREIHFAIFPFFFFSFLFFSFLFFFFFFFNKAATVSARGRDLRRVSSRGLFASRGLFSRCLSPPPRLALSCHSDNQLKDSNLPPRNVTARVCHGWKMHSSFVTRLTMLPDSYPCVSLLRKFARRAERAQMRLGLD